MYERKRSSGGLHSTANNPQQQHLTAVVEDREVLSPSSRKHRSGLLSPAIVVSAPDLSPSNSASCLCVPPLDMEVTMNSAGGGGGEDGNWMSASSSSVASAAAVVGQAGGAAIRPTHVSLSQLVLLNAVVCGLEFCASAAFTYIPPMLLKSGIPEERMSIVLGIGPFLGFFFVPMIGRASDRCRSSFGRRRPFILGLGLLLIISLVIIPYGELFAVHLFGIGTTAKAAAIWLLRGA